MARAKIDLSLLMTYSKNPIVVFLFESSFYKTRICMREKSAVELVHDIIRAKNKTKNKSDKKKIIRTSQVKLEIKKKFLIFLLPTTTIMKNMTNVSQATCEL